MSPVGPPPSCRPWQRALYAFGALGWLAACSPSLAPACPAVPEAASAPARARLERERVVAEWTGGKVTYGELLEETEASVDELAAEHERKLFSVEQKALTELVTQRLLRAAAHQAGQSFEAYLEQLFAGVEVSAEDARAFYATLQDEARPFEEIAPRIVEHLEERERQTRARALVDCLHREAGTRLDLPAPPAAVAQFDLQDRPMKGATEAPLTVVLFEDFQCPYCADVRHAVQALLDAFPGKLRVFYLHFPLSFHEAAMGAALGAQCAHRQGKFWPMHDRLYEHQASLLGTADALAAHAEAVGLDLPAFRRCFEAPETEAFVQADLEMGRAAGVEGTPSVFVNGVAQDGVPTASEIALRVGASPR